MDRMREIGSHHRNRCYRQDSSMDAKKKWKFQKKWNSCIALKCLLKVFNNFKQESNDFMENAGRHKVIKVDVVSSETY